MGFTFGAPAPAATAPAAAGGAPAPSTGGFSFGGGGASSTASAPSTAATPSTTGFSFGGNSTPAATSATTTAAAPASTTTGFGLAPPSQQPSQPQQQEGRPKPITTIPPYSTLFPRNEIQVRVEEALFRYKLMMSTSSDSLHNNNNNGGGGGESFAALELIELLSTSNNISSTIDDGGGGGNNIIPNGENGGEDIIIGQYLANPTSILHSSSTNTNNNNSTNNNSNVNEILKRELLQTASQSVSQSMNNTTTNCDGNSNIPCITLNNQLTGIIPSIACEVLQLVDELHLDKTTTAGNNGSGDGDGGGGMVEGLCLYAKARMELDGSGGGEMDDINNRGGGEEQDEFVKMLIEGGKVGFEKFITTTSSSSTAAEGDQGRAGSTTNNTLQQQQQQQQQSSSSSQKTSRVISTARKIYFHERSALLSTVYNLIRHRVEAYTDIISQEDDEMNDGDTGGGGATTNKSSAVLVATDQLISYGLVDNLIQTVRELTLEMESIVKRLQTSATTAAAVPQQQQQQAFGGSGTGGLFGTSSSTTLPTTTNSAQPMKKNLDMEYALLGFTHMQRQIASECLFYLAYHTQLTIGEVTSIIDLVKDLTNGSSSGGGGGIGGGLPLLDPLLKDVPSPYMDMTNDNAISAANSSWYQQHYQQQQQQHQQHHQSPYGGGGASGGWMMQSPSLPMPKLKDPKEWNEELITSLWGRGQPQLLQCVSTLLMSIVCAFDSRHVLMNRESHGPNSFGVGNALFPPQDHQGIDGTPELLAIHSRLDPNSQSAEEAWKRRDIYGLLLISYALLLRPAASQLVSPRGSPQHPLNRSPPHRGVGGSGGVDVKGTFSKCLMVASQLKSLTFARLSLIPSFGMPSTMSSSSATSSSSHRTTSDDASTYDFFVSIFAEFTAQYIDSLCHTGNVPITRKEWYDEELNLAQSEWMEKDQKRQFGMWAGHAVEEDIGGPRPVNIMDRPDCLEDVFALISCICACNPDGAQAFWNTTEEHHDVGDGKMEATVVLAPSRCLRMLDLIQAESDSALFVYLSFLSSLALSGGTDDSEGSNGASMVHSFLSGSRVINAHSERHMHFNWDHVMRAVRWYAEQLSPDEGEDSDKNVSSDRIRRSSTSDNPESSTSYYYGASQSDTANTSGDSSSSASSPMNSRQGTSSSSYSSKDTKHKELDDVGRSTLMSVLCLISNVATRSSAAREYILSIQLPANDSDGTGTSYQDGSLEILFSLLTVPIPPKIQGLAFMAIANLIRADQNSTQVSPGESKKSRAALRAWELLEICQFIPIKLLSQYSSYAAGTSATTSISAFGRKQNQGDLPAACFPQTNEYMMVFQLEHVEAEAGTYPATEGFLFLLSTLIKHAGCPSNLGSQWRLRPGVAPYIEYAVDFVLPRATGMAKNVKPLLFASVADECRLINRAMEVVEAVLVRYVVPPILPSISKKKTFDEMKAQYQAGVNAAGTESGLASMIPEIFSSGDDLEEDDMNAAIQDFKNEFIYSSDNAMNPAGAGKMLEASFGNKVPCPKTPGFSIMVNLLSTNKGLLFKIIMKLLAEHGGASGVQECNKMISSESLATSLFRETPPNLACTKNSMFFHAEQRHNVLDEASYRESLSTVQQGMIQPINPLLLISCSDGGCLDTNEKGAAVDDAVLWRERTLVMSLRILCAAAAREEAFLQSLKNSNASLSIVPTLLFKGPIHGSMTHRFVDEQKINVSKMSQLLTTSSFALHRTNPILPVIAEYVGYNACSLVNPQGIAAGSFSIISYISQGIPQAEFIRSLCGDDINGVGLTRAFSKGLSLPVPETYTDSNLRDVILDLILSNIGLESNSSLNFSLMMLGLSGSRQNCFNVILDLVADVDFVMNPSTSSMATKCFELIFRVCELGSRRALPELARTQQVHLTEKLRRSNFWHSQAVRYMGQRGGSAPSILHEVSRYFRYDQDQDATISKRNNDVLHSMAWLLKGLAVEMRFLMNAQGSTRKNQFHSLLSLLLSHRDPLLLSALIDLPLGQAKEGSIWQKLHSWEPPADALHKSRTPLNGVAEVCGGYEIVDVGRLLGYIDSQQSVESAREWALTWNMFVQRSCASSHACNAWSDAVRTVFICYHVFLKTTERVEQNLAMNKRLVLETLSAILLRLLSPSHFDALAQYSCLSGITEDIVAEEVGSECAMPLCNAVLSLTEVLLESSNDEADAIRVVEEDTARVCMWLIGAISSCANSEPGTASNDLCGALLSCALTRVLTSSETWCIISENIPLNILEIYANATAYLFNLAASPVFANPDRYSNVHEAQRGNVALAARSGLSSFFGHLNSLETEDSTVELFCSKIFTLESIRKSVSRLAQLIPTDDNYIADLLQQMVLLHADGAQLLAKSGITREILSFAHSYASEEKKYLSSHMGVSGAASLTSPPVLDGHLSLLNVLLSSRLPSHDLHSISIDTLKILKEYSSTGERLFQSFPADVEITMKFLETLYLTYSSLRKVTDSSAVENSPVYVDEQLLKLERNVLSIAYQLSAFPFPSELVPPLPIGLVNVEKIHASQMKTIATHFADVPIWWDKVSDAGAPLPTPPTGSSDAGVLHRYNSFNNRPGSTFSEGKYHQAIAAAKCLDVSLMFLLSRVAIVNKRKMDTFSVDSVAIAKGLCRCSDASRAIQDRLASMKSHPEEDITTLLKSSLLAPNSKGDQSLQLQLEKEYLLELGSCLGRCAEKLVSLALQDARRMSEYKNDQEWAYFVGAMTPALDHTQVETKGVGCLFDDAIVEKNRLNAQALRQEIEKMKASFL